MKKNKQLGQLVKKNVILSDAFGETEKIASSKNVFRDYGYFDNKNNYRIVCFNVSRTYLHCERPNENIGDCVANVHKTQILFLRYVLDT